MLSPSVSLKRGGGRGGRGGHCKSVKVCDCRHENAGVQEKLLKSGPDFNDFLNELHKEFSIQSHETFVVSTTDRAVLDYDTFAALEDGSTLYLFRREDQALPTAREETITFQPHYDTLIQSGTYEYYASNDKNSFPYALAELIDNSLSATAKNPGVRTIEIRMLFDETLGKPAVIVLDNGCGMTSKQLNNWAVYRLSKFLRDDSKSASKDEKYVRPDHVPRSLNSDISYFGVGGKQAIFYIGNSVRMITKPVGSPDVHEMVMSKADFEEKERNNEDIYKGTIKNRKPGDSSHVKKNGESFLRDLIAEESGKESFTAVVMTGVLPDHITFLKDDFSVWTRELTHIYHYYIHGVNGNDLRRSSTNSDQSSKIDIQVTLREKPNKLPRVLNLREVEDDMQTLYINATADTFEFHVSSAVGSGRVEGLIRYHPFLYDRETYPEEPDTMLAPVDDESDDNESGDLQQARGKRPVFECFWNGRLIPYTTIPEFEWCALPKGNSKLPAECYSRFSGVLFTNDTYKVSTNKLTFMDLELKLKSSESIFTRVVNGQRQRVNIKSEFNKWLQNCHDKLDKQTKFLRFKEIITRPDVPTKKMQFPWATFSSIQFGGKKYQTGQLVKSQKTQPIFNGTVTRFLLFGNHDRDVFATGGDVEVTLEPKELYDTTKIIPISKIDRNATVEAINENIDKDRVKLPEVLKVDWPQGVPWPQNAVRPAGTPLGPIKVEIQNKNGESLSRMPSVTQGTVRKLGIELRLIQHDPKGSQTTLISLFAPDPHKTHYFWFKTIDNLKILGKYSLCLNTVVNESKESKAKVVGGKPLPSFKLNFTITAGKAESFSVGAVRTTLNVGVPFDIPLEIKDGYDHPTKPPQGLRPELKCSGLELSYEAVDCTEKSFTIRGVKARGKVQNYQQSKPYDLKVTVPGLKKDSQTIKISLLPGKPHSIHVTQGDEPITVENGNSVTFNVEIHDEAGNITAHPKLTVRCQVPSLAAVNIDCSSTGAGQLVTKPIDLLIIKGEPQQVKVKFDLLGWKNVSPVERELNVLPSTRVARMELCCQNDENLILRNKDKIEWLAGGVLENLFYKLYDEAGREVSLTAEIAATIKVNWTADVNLEDLVQGKLPDIQVPSQVQLKKTGFYQVSYKDQSVSASFTITPRPDEPTRLKATVPQNTMKLGEPLPGNINLELVDQYDNVTKTLTSACVKLFSVEAEGLDKSALIFTWKGSSGSVVLTGVRFQSGTPGSREMVFSYKNYVERVIVEVTAGVPTQFKLISGPEMPLQVLNDQGIPTAFVIQLCDQWGNVSPDQRVVVELRPSPPALKVRTSVTSQPVNAEGKVSFIVESVSGPKGYYQLEFIASFNKRPINSPAVNLTVIPNPNKPVSLSVEYNTNATFPAAGVFPVFSVTVVSDEGSPITTFNPAVASMFLWMGTPSGGTPPITVPELKPSKPKANEKKDRFHFRDKEIPEKAGDYVMQFSLLVDTENVLYSDQITIHVGANQPVKLGPDFELPAPVVSYTKDIANRTLVENMTLRITDSYGNTAGQDLEGKVVVSIKSHDDDRNKRLPLFEGKTNKVQFCLKKGKINIPRLAIMQESPGEDNSLYILLFTPEVSTALAPFKLPFHFYNDSSNQRIMAELSIKKHALTEELASQREYYNTYRELLQELTAQLQDASSKEADLRNQLILNMNIPKPVNMQSIDRLINEKTPEMKRSHTNRRICSIPNQFKGKDVLGKVGHLAFVEDDDAARVISWHIRGYIDCVITRTTEAAQIIYRETQGRQKVMPLDSVFVNSGNRPLPHMKNGRMVFNPPGNPMFAKDLLIYPGEKESCEIVFKNILRDTILIDDLDSANHYRRAVVQNKMPCPTILTRQGDMISGQGMFGGAQNKAPPIRDLQVFAAPLPQEYHDLNKQIEMLNKYKSVLKSKEDAHMDREEHRKALTSPDMQNKQREMKEKEKHLEQIERQLASMHTKPAKRGAESAAEPSGITPKRTRQMNNK
ncbi:structural maintenance of chromosomes flexible hinge domain-containing protein 1 isoform X2 [Scomber scombrus]|uniref:Structural maintenance of chromosomes flexible hinge domain-containing protein 1 isoform X2 n=1 Tax=Scomber scombrus TaxID=13677 RepID=A0AAV1PI81_SCOSC